MAEQTIDEVDLASLENDRLLALTTLLIADRRFKAGLKVANALTEADMFFEIAKRFNAAMADWGLRQEPNNALFAEVLELGATFADGMDSANFNQCLGLTSAVLGKRDEMLFRLSRAKELIANSPSEFSCWTFTTVARDEFVRHCQAVELFGEGEGTPPEVVLAIAEMPRLV